MAQLPTKAEAVRRIQELAEAEQLEISQRAAKQTDRLGYTGDDVCDMLYELTESACECVEESHWEPNIPVGTFRAVFCTRRREEDGHDPDTLFVEVAIRPQTLFLLACKLYGSPE